MLASVGILLNIARSDGVERELRCVIAAGGTAGHVLPSLAVGGGARARGVQVTLRRVAGPRRGAARP